MEHFYRTATPLERVFLLHNLQLAQSERDPKTCALADVASYYIAPEMPTA
jgi:hypothetical protein